MLFKVPCINTAMPGILRVCLAQYFGIKAWRWKFSNKKRRFSLLFFTHLTLMVDNVFFFFRFYSRPKDVHTTVCQMKNHERKLWIWIFFMAMCHVMWCDRFMLLNFVRLLHILCGSTTGFKVKSRNIQWNWVPKYIAI